MEPSSPVEIELSALDGSNLLAFMAAVGTLRVADRRSRVSRCRMSWALRSGDGLWRPILIVPRSSKDVIEDVCVSLCMSGRPSDELTRAERAARNKSKETRKSEDSDLDLVKRSESEWYSSLDRLPHPPAFCLYSQFFCPVGRFVETANRFLATKNEAALEHLSSYCTDAVLEEGEMTAETDFRGLRNMRDDDKPGILSYFRKLAEESGAEHLRASLLSPWSYPDGTEYSLRWDSDSSRSHALSAKAPADDKSGVTLRGANRLAIEALPLFPVMPVGHRARTTGFTRFEKEPEITWPIWVEPLGVDEVRTLLSLAELQKERPPRLELEARGVLQVFRSRRFNDGQYRNFSPARALL